MAFWRLEQLSREMVRHVAPTACLVIPVAAIEQHGPDLPVGTDLLLCQGIVERSSQLAAEHAGMEIIVAPAVAYGYSPHHLPYPGVFTVRSETLLEVLQDLGESAHQSGFHRIFFFNGHGGNEEIIRLAARRISHACDLVVGAASYWTLALAKLQEAKFQALRIPGHAGDFELSLLLALGVAWESGGQHAAHKAPETTEDPSIPTATYAVQRRGEMLAINGYTDRSEAGSAALGERLLAIMLPSIANALEQFARETLPIQAEHTPQQL